MIQVTASIERDGLVEQDHRRVKQRYYPMLGFKNVSNAAVTLRGTELVQKIKKGQARQIKHQPRGSRDATGMGSCARGVNCNARNHLRFLLFY